MLNSKQKKCIKMLVSGDMSQNEIAKALGVNPGTISDWKKKEEFWEEYNRANKIVINSIVPKAVQTVKSLLNADSEQVRLAAAKDVLDRAGYKAQDDIKLNANITSEKLADVFKQIGGEGLAE